MQGKNAKSPIIQLNYRALLIVKLNDDLIKIRKTMEIIGDLLEI